MGRQVVVIIQIVYALLPIGSLFALWGVMRLRVGTSPFGIAFVLWLAWAALAGRALSLFDVLGSRIAWAGVELVPIAVLVLLISKGATPEIRRLRIGEGRSHFREVATSTPASVIIGACVIGLYLVGLIANLVLPQTMDDSLTAYLARVGFWIQDGSISRFPTSPYNFPIVAYPALPTLSTLRWVVLTRSESLPSLDQWLAAFACASLVYAICRQLKVTRGTSLVLSGVWMTSSVVILQSQMVLNDLIAVGFLLAAIWCMTEWIGRNDPRMASLGIVSVFGALGTKQTVLFLVPSFVITSLVVVWYLRNRGIIERLKFIARSLHAWIALLVGVVLSAPEYVRNLSEYGHPLGPESSFVYFSDPSVTASVRISAVWTNLRAVLLAGAFGDVPTWFADRFSDFYGWVRKYYEIAGLEYAQEQGVGWFGFSMTLLAVAGLVAGWIFARRSKSTIWWLLLVANAALFSVLFLYTRPNFSEAFSRYMLIPMTLLLIAGAFVLDGINGLLGGRLTRAGFQSVILLVALLSVVQGSWSLLGNGTRPLTGPNDVWGRSPNETMLYSNGFLDRDTIQKIMSEVDRCVDPDGRLGAAIPGKFPVSRLFGPEFSREVRFIFPPPPAEVSARSMEADGWSALIIDDAYRGGITVDTSGLWYESFGQYTLFRLRGQVPGCD